jgi:hypothetical protein
MRGTSLRMGFHHAIAAAAARQARISRPSAKDRVIDIVSEKENASAQCHEPGIAGNGHCDDDFRYAILEHGAAWMMRMGGENVDVKDVSTTFVSWNALVQTVTGISSLIATRVVCSFRGSYSLV